MIPAEQEGIAYAEIDIEKIIDFKYYIDPAGHYSNQSLSMNFNRNPTPVVRMYGESDSVPIPYEENIRPVGSGDAFSAKLANGNVGIPNRKEGLRN